jgi:chloramphenicol-sensitive protein RarD
LPGREFLVFGAQDFDWVNTILLIGAGIVTLAPLLLFAQAANRIPLTWIGFLQYVSPSITLLLGVFIYGEAFTTAHAICFSLIWIGLALITAEMFWKLQRTT